MARSHKLTDQERDERREQDRERLELAARELLPSDGWARWVKVRSSAALGRYSLRNQWLISAEGARRGSPRPMSPGSGHGSRSIASWPRAPRRFTSWRQSPSRIAPPGGEETGEKRTFFRSVPVFDASQTEVVPGMEPVPLSPPSQPITGDSHVHLLAPVEQLAGDVGYRVIHRALDGGADGWCDYANHEIVVNERLPANARVRVLVHEIAHSLGVGYREYGRQRAEVLIDTVTYAVLAGQIGLDVGGESIPYVAGWGEAGELDAIRQYAETIDQIARRIEDAILPAAVAVPADQPRELERVA